MLRTIVILVRVIAILAMSLLLFRYIAHAQAPMPVPDSPIDAATRNAVIDSLVKELNDGYIFPDVAKKMEADLRARQVAKEFDSIASSIDFAKRLTEDLRSISHDRHLRVGYSADVIPVRAGGGPPTAEERAKYVAFAKRRNYAFNKVERMDGNIGYIDLTNFFDPDGGGNDTVAAAIGFVANTDSVIFDLRNNGGGEPEMIALISSYLFGDKPVHLNDLYFREGDRTQEFWTKPELAAKKITDKDIYVLTSNRTFSGGEEFANNLKVLKRATIVGETTGGGANPGGDVRLNDHFNAFIPVGRAVNPITKTNWEGVGVEPDIKVPKEQALKTAYLMALTRSAANTKDDQIKAGLDQLIDKTRKELDELKQAGKK